MLNIFSIRTIIGYSSAILLLSLFTVISVHPATFTVTKVADTNDSVCDADCSLREAVNAANNASSDDTIVFEQIFFNTPRTISITGSRLIISNNGTLTVNGPGSNLLTVSGNGSMMIFSIETVGANVSLNNLRLDGGFSAAAGGAIYSRGIVSVSNLVVNNSINAISNNGTMTITNSTVSNNIGLGILNEDGTLSISNSTVSNNTSSGISSNRGNLTVTNSNVSNNTATIGGAGIRNQDGTAILDTVRINNNSTTGFGNDGAGVASVTSNFSTPATMTIRNSTINNNVVNGERSYGGGVAALNGNAITIINTTISNNRSIVGDGGGIYARSPVTLINSVVSNNTAAGNGGGITSLSIINLTNSTICNNTANTGGGIYRDPISDSIALVTLKNSIVGDNQSTSITNPAPDFFGNLSSQGYNLIENTTNTIITGTMTGNILGQDAQLLPLGDYGGATQTVGLLPTSPAVDAADPNSFPAADQRGISRPNDGDLNGSALPDIGAYERQLTIFTVTKTADTIDNVCDSDCSLREAISKTNTATTPDNAIVFDASVFSSPQTITLASGHLLILDNKNLFIKGPGANLLSVSGNQLSRVFFFDINSKAAVEGLTISNGRETQGSGIWLNNFANLSVNNCVIRENTTTQFEGAGIHNNSGKLLINNSRIINNTSFSRGGGLYGGGTTIINNSSFDNNSSMRDGGGIYIFGGFLTVNNSQISNNRAITTEQSANSGGGIYFNGQTLTINNSTISNNTAAGNVGGGLYNNTTAFLYNTTVSRNSALGAGGISQGFFAAISIISSTVSNNTSAGGAGGIHFGFGSGVNNLINSTVASNSTIGEGGGIVNPTATLNLKNSIIADNTATISSPDFKGAVNSQGYSLIENTNGLTISGTTTGNITGVDPQLLPLKNYGGLTQAHALRLTSPAIDKGNNSGIVTDQRGKIRPYDNPQIPNGSGNGTDIGAFERQNGEIIPNVKFDFDGDGKTDIGIFRPAPAEWWISSSSNNQVSAAQFGQASDKPVAADYTGDGKTDIAFFRPSTGQWFILRSEDGSFYGFPFGTGEDIPAPGDFDGDGKTDAAVFRPSQAVWYIKRSSDGEVIIQQFGIAEDKPVVADYDGDGKDDIGVYRPSQGQWWILRSSQGLLAVQFGQTGDKTVQGDYTGDGKADIAFFRESNGFWYIIRSEDNSFYGFPFGSSGDIPAPGDYDGDGKSDAAVFRPSNTGWYIQRSSGGITSVQFGTNGDAPIPGTFVRQ